MCALVTVWCKDFPKCCPNFINVGLIRRREYITQEIAGGCGNGLPSGTDEVEGRQLS